MFLTKKIAQASAALAEWSVEVEDDVRQEPVPEAQTFTSLFETEAVDQEVEEVDENLLVGVRGVRSVVVGVDLYSGASL